VISLFRSDRKAAGEAMQLAPASNFPITVNTPARQMVKRIQNADNPLTMPYASVLMGTHG
jgi:hypothetical protein